MNIVDNQAKKLIADRIYEIVGHRAVTDFRKKYDMASFFKRNDIAFNLTDTEVLVTWRGRPVADALRRWSAHRVNLGYREIKPAITWRA